MALLQVALDLVNGHRAIQIAQEAIEGGVDWIEAGTPLIKAEGIEILRSLKKTGKTIVADMKTMDVGGVEAEIVAKAGGNIICVLALASDETIKEVVKSARRYGIEVMVDFIGVDDVQHRAIEVEGFGADYLLVHTSVDQQMVGKNPFVTLERVISVAHVPVAVAGGINAQMAKEVVKKGAQIVVVGGAVIKAENVCEATAIIKRAMEGEHITDTSFKKYGQDEIAAAFSRVSTCNICDAMHNRGAMRGIHPITKNIHMVGRAVTVKTIDGDWAKVVQAVDKASSGSVIVAQAGEGIQAVWGELATHSALKKQLAGIIIDGAIRDVQIIKNLEIPVFSKTVVPEAGEPKGYGEIGSEILCGGQFVRKGDWIIGDDNGVVVVPKQDAHEIANRAIHVMERENRIREEIQRGGTLSTVLNIEKWEMQR